MALTSFRSSPLTTQSVAQSAAKLPRQSTALVGAACRLPALHASCSATRRLQSLGASTSGSDVFHTKGHQRAGLLPFFGGRKKKEGKNAGLLAWARGAATGCQLAPAAPPEGLEVATFAGGCFWGVELAFQRAPGVVKTTVGYTAGHDPSPTYESVCSGRTGHTEAVQVYYDPKETTYEQLLDTFFQHVDPTTKNRQGGDMGTQYRSGIYYYNDAQKEAIHKAIDAVNEKLQQNAFRRVLGTKVVSEVLPAGDYYIAEDYHQQYLARGGRFGMPQSTEKGATEKIRCYG